MESRDLGWNHATHTSGTAKGHVLLDTKASANQRLGALSASADEALAMPVNVAPGHALISWSNGQLAAFASAGIEFIIALQTERHVGLLVGNVLLSGQWVIALQAAEMLNVVRGTLSRGILLGEDQLIAGLAAWYLQLNGQISTAVDLSVMEEVH